MQIWKDMIQAAESVCNPRVLSRCVDAGGVAAAVLTDTGNIYTGVCVDTSSSLGTCAERNALFSMITRGEHIFRRVLALDSDGRILPPCGACRELMLQLMPDRPGDVEILVDRAGMRVVSLADLVPYWWA